MKYVLKISLITAILLLVFGSSLLAQKETPNNIVFKEDVVKDFWDYIDTMNQLSGTNSEIIQSFLKRYDETEMVILNSESDIVLYKNDPINAYKKGRDLTSQVLSDTLNYKKNMLESKSLQVEKSNSPHYWIWIVVVVLIIALMYFLKSRKKWATIIIPSDNLNNDKSNSSDDNDIVIRRKTTSVMKQQSLEDVINNENYLKIDCDDFCDDSAVKRMYIKNSCIKEIYNRYAEDLRNPDNPKEDGCMVLGRWVHNQESDEYYVSLEQVVFPGDDAVLSEYELNFGAKIKLNIITQLRKLRQETQLQYDLTCWVHSHPGIGVFFSNTDHSLHMLHKHPTHPKFLTAIVVDILTPQQELGIFTFKHDMTINSKAELKKTYSLEDWYKWAVESSKNAYKAEDHFDTLKEVNTHIDSCHDIHLSNGAIIDMGMLATEHHEGFIGFVQGFTTLAQNNTEYIATKVSVSEEHSEHDVIGSFIIVTHCSIPSVRKALGSQLNNIGFVLVYSTADGLLTSIPVVNNDLCNDQNFYGEQRLEDLKIWTRRKR